MYIIKNPTQSRPLSANVKHLMKMERESALNPNVKKIGRAVTARNLLYCDMQGNIVMGAVDRRLSIADSAPVYMTSQLVGVIDHHFSVDGGREIDNSSAFLRMPLLLKSPETTVDVVVWLNDIREEKNIIKGELLRRLQLLGVDMNQAKRSRIEGQHVAIVDCDLIVIAPALGVSTDSLWKQDDSSDTMALWSRISKPY